MIEIVIMQKFLISIEYNLDVVFENLIITQISILHTCAYENFLMVL